MNRKYYSARVKFQPLSLQDLYSKLKYLFLLFFEKDYFSQAGISKDSIPTVLNCEANFSLNFAPFPIHNWKQEDITEDHIFDTIEFLFDHVSKPGERTLITTETGFNYYGYEDYDKNTGQEEFRSKANTFLSEYKAGYELTENGMILSLGSEGLQYIIDAEIICYDEVNIDSKVRNAILKWRNRQMSLLEKKEAIRELADVFEWLKKNKALSAVLDGKDESALFEIVNNFALRHHNPQQKSNYDKNIWYSWMFHFYLATYHAVIRLLLKKETA